jgi:hypothetical protein
MSDLLARDFDRSSSSSRTKRPRHGVPTPSIAQRLGRERWYAEYRITVCDAVRDYSFKA